MKKHFVKEYENTLTVNHKGKVVNQVIYKGDYYCSSKEEKKELLSLSVLFIGIMLIAFFINGCVSSQSSNVLYIALPYVAYFLPFVYMIMGIYRLMKNPLKMEKIQKEHSYDRILRCSIGILVLSVLGVLGSIIYLVTNNQIIHILTEVRFLCLNAIIGMVSFLLLRYVSKSRKKLQIEARTKK